MHHDNIVSVVRCIDSIIASDTRIGEIIANGRHIVEATGAAARDQAAMVAAVEAAVGAPRTGEKGPLTECRFRGL